MTSTHVQQGGHHHVFLGDDHDRNEHRTWLVIALTATMMVAEIAAGTIFGSMALVADGWHMSTHAAAMLIAVLAYGFARRNAHNPRFTFGTGKVGDLAAFASAIVLALVAVMIAWESILRLRTPLPINVTQAMAVAVLGLAVNLISAWLLRGDHHHHHGHDHGHHHDHDHEGHDHDHHASGHRARDNNLHAAYMHVLADALTSVLAIVALLAAGLYGWVWLDPAMGIVGALVIARWSWGLIRDAGGVLLDYGASDAELSREIREAVETSTERITDLHVWQLGPGHHGAIIALASSEPQAPSHYREKLAAIHELSHVTVEVEPLRA